MSETTTPIRTADFPSYKALPVAGLVPYAKNSRTHSADQVLQIAASIKEFGFTNPVLVDGEGGIIAGHGRVLAAKKLRMETVPVIVLDHLTEAQRRAYVIADNQLALNAGWDDAVLRSELLELADLDVDLSLLGFTSAELDAMLAQAAAEAETGGLTDPDDVPDPGAESVSRTGDVWVCGRHRVMCGSALDPADVSILMEGKQADMVWTDPPYLMDFRGAVGGDGKTRSKHRAIANDKLGKSEGEQFLRDFTGQLGAWCRGAWYITFYRLGIDWMFEALKANGLRWRNLIVWKKQQLNLSNSDYKSIYEPMFVGWSDDWQPVFYGWGEAHEFHGRKGETDVWECEVPSVWEIKRTAKNDLHPTMKPVALIERAVLNSSKPGQVVLDFFGGSGTTLIAAHATARVGRVIELDPLYVDVIVRRWQGFSGQVATLEGDGRSFDQLTEVDRDHDA